MFLIWKNILANNRNKTLLWIVVTANVVFFFLYKLFLKHILLNHFNNLQDQINKSYYTKIFSFLEFPIISITIILLLLILFYNHVKGFLSNIKNEIPFLIIVLCFNVLIQLVIMITVQTLPIADSKYYIDLALRLYQSGSYVNPNRQLTSFWPIGLPAYLSWLMYLNTNYLILAKIFNIVISTVFIFVLYLVFRKELTIKGRIIFLLAFTLFPDNLFSSNCIMADYPFSLLLWLSIYIIMKYRNNNIIILLTSLILALMSYLRPVGLLLPIIFLIDFFKSYNLEISLRHSFILIIGFCLVLSPWIYRNYKIFHKFVPISTNGGFNFLMGNHDNSSGGVNFEFHYDNSLQETKASENAYSKGTNNIITHPVESLLRLPMKIIFSYYRGDSSITWSLKETKNRIPAFILSFIFFFTNFFFYLILIISILGIISYKKIFKNNTLKYFMGALYVYFILIIVIYVGAERYLIPIIPIHFFFVGKYFS